MLAIGEVAMRAGLRVSAIRYFEEQGLVPKAQRRGGKRIYDASVLDRLALIELAKGAGFSLSEIRDLVGGIGRRQAAAAGWKSLAQEKLAELEEQMSRTSRMRDLLSMLVLCECPTLDDCGRAFHVSRSQPPSMALHPTSRRRHRAKNRSPSQAARC